MLTPLMMYFITRLSSITIIITACWTIVLLLILFMIIFGISIYLYGRMYKTPDELRHLKKAVGETGYASLSEYNCNIEKADNYIQIGLSIKTVARKYVLPAFIILSLLSSFIPTTKEAIAIYFLPKIVNNEQVQQLPENFLKLINSKLIEWAKDNDIVVKNNKEEK